MPNSTSAREQTELRHLARVQELTQEIATAIAAIEQNNLARFQESILKQEFLCSELAALRWAPCAFKAGNGCDASGETGTVAEKIQESYVSLAQLNRVYAEVVRRSKRATELLLAVYSLAGVQPNLFDKDQTLSCEV
jgi:hypothetical protein